MVTDPKDTGMGTHYALRQEDARGLAVQALSLVRALGAVGDKFHTPQMHAICDAFVHPDEGPRHEIITSLLSNGMSEEELIDRVIPTTAAIMGDRWLADTLSFADVTIGSARLQETMRALSARASHPSIADGDRILLVAPRIENHTLGMFVAKQQFRRLGIDVQLAVGMYPRQILQEVKRQRFPMIGITSAGRRCLASARELVDTLRANIPRAIPIVVGGSVTSLDLDIKALTGCDYVCSDPAKVIELCDLKTSVNAERINA